MKLSKLIIIVSLFVFSLSSVQAGDYDWGYSDGCDSAKGDWTKDYEEYRYNYQYSRGWNEGNRYCKYHYTNRYERNGFQRVDKYKQRNYQNRIYKKRNYNQGYRDGCRTTRYRYTKNRYKFRNIDSYRRGWLSGRRACR